MLTKELDEYCKINNLLFEDLRNLLIKQQFKRLQEKTIFFQSRGIKVKIVSWLNDMIDLIKNDELLSHTHVPLLYEENEFETIQNLMDYDKNLEIEYDFQHNKFMHCEDKHPNVKCHKIIANSIIENIKKDI